jgi:hypothetical protein
MCPGDDCSIKNCCYRYRAVPDLAQHYFQEIPFDFKKNECAGFKSFDKTSAPIRKIDDQSWDVIVKYHRKQFNDKK